MLKISRNKMSSVQFNNNFDEIFQRRVRYFEFKSEWQKPENVDISINIDQFVVNFSAVKKEYKK